MYSYKKIEICKGRDRRYLEWYYRYINLWCIITAI